MVDSDNGATLRAQTGILRVTQVVAPILVLVGTIYAGAQVDAFVGPADMPVTSPLSAAMIMGVFMFPGGAFFIARGLVIWSRARQARFWPTVNGHIAEEQRVLPLSYWVPYWYVVNGIRYDKKLVLSGATPTGKDQPKPTVSRCSKKRGQGAQVKFPASILARCGYFSGSLRFTCWAHRRRWLSDITRGFSSSM